MSESLKKKYSDVKKLLSEVSSSFCIAKWNYLYLNLQIGEGKSCCHPKAHKISPLGLIENPSLFHNTAEKQKSRTKMLNGERPEECNYCWSFEESSFTNSKDSFDTTVSDRIVKSTHETEVEISSILKDPLSEHYLPKFLELSFGNLCNLKCVYCGPNQSSLWEQELKDFGEIKELNHPPHQFTKAYNSSAYLKPFWNWWPKLKSSLVLLTLTGGEPFLSQPVFDLLEDIANNEVLNFNLVINTNLASPKVVFEKNIKILKKIYELKRVKKIKIVTSMESVGPSAEYIRSGLNFELFWSNLTDLIDLSFCDISITSTVNVLSIGSFYNFYKKISELKLRKKNNNFMFFIDPALLLKPSFLSILNFSNSIKKIFLDELNKIISESFDLALSEYEIIKVKNLSLLLSKKVQGPEESETNKLFSYLTEVDKRRRLNFKKTFPNLYLELSKGNLLDLE